MAIARALVGEPKLVLADEATGNLDSETGDAVLELLSGLAARAGAATVLVTHDERAAHYADRVLTIRDGRLTESERRVKAPSERRMTGYLRTLLLFYRRHLRVQPLRELMAVAGVAAGVALLFAVQVAHHSITGSFEELLTGCAGKATWNLPLAGRRL